MMKATTTLSILALGVLLSTSACGTGEDTITQPAGSAPPDEGAFDRTDREAVDSEMAERGYELYTSQCESCHRVGSEDQATHFVGITERRDQEWIMDFLMDHDLAPQEPRDEPLNRENCKVRQPGQGLDQQQAQEMYEYMLTL